MMLSRTACAALIGVALATPAASAQSTSAGGEIDVKLLPISLHRIQRELRQSSETSSQEGLRLRYQVDVYGRAPAIELFTRDDNLRDGPVPYGGPTHKQMLEMMTPQEFRAPVADFTSFMRWLADRAAKK
jgi:hypothetical protein